MGKGWSKLFIVHPDDDNNSEDVHFPTTATSDTTPIINKKKGIPCWSVYKGLIATLILALLLGFLIPFAIIELILHFAQPELYTCAMDPTYRIPCIVGGINPTRDYCEAVGCCYDDKQMTVNGVRAPQCFHTNTAKLDYKLTDINGNVSGYAIQFHMKPLFNDLKPFNESLVTLKFELNAISDSYVRIRGQPEDPNIKPSAVPVWKDLPIGNLSKPLYGVVHSQADDRFTLKIVRHQDNVTIVDLDGGPLIMTKNYVEFNIKTPSTNIYGLGEGTHTTLRHNMDFKVWRLFDRSGLATKNGKLYYGVHPLYVCVENSGNAHGVLLGLSQPSEVALNPGPSISFRTSGGVIDIHVFAGPTPQDVIRQYTDLVGKPFMPPQWALGYHTCRASGNTSTSEIVVSKMTNASIPHESDCGDALLLRTLSPKLDTKTWKQLSAIGNTLESTDRKFILYQGLQVRNGSSTSSNQNPAYDEGFSQLIFINKTRSSVYVGKLKSGAVAYPDVFSDHVASWMSDQQTALRDLFIQYNIPMDGIVLVDNTPLDNTNKTATPCPAGPLPPVANYTVNYYKEGNDTVCLTALETDSTPHYVRHNLYGLYHTKLVAETLDSNRSSSAPVVRQFVVSLSTYSGSGTYSGHWGGEVDYTWSDMNNTIIQMLEFGLYGVPLTGAPICGYQGAITSESLCWKWMQLGSLYPLALTYYGQNQYPREPIFFEKSFQTMSRDALLVRYRLLPYLYTLFYNANKYGDPVVRPMFYEFPKDPQGLSNSHQFFWGSGLLITPNVNPDSVIAYFPPGYWYEYQTHRCIKSTNGTYYSLINSDHLANIHIRGGSVIIQQYPALTTVKTRINNYSIVVALDQNVTQPDDISARGEVYLDDGLTLDSPMLRVEFVATNSSYASQPIQIDPEFDPTAFNISTKVDVVYILGVPSKPAEITYTFDGQSLVLQDQPNDIVYIEATQSLICNFTSIQQTYDLRQNLTIVWS